MPLALALTLTAAALEPGIAPIEHRTRVEHGGTMVEAHYTTRVSIVRRQIGTVTKPGTPSTHACAWRADITVERQARHGSGASFSRKMIRSGVIEGRQPGWCTQENDAIAQQVTRSTDTIRDHAAALARQDEPVLQAELATVAGPG